MTDLFVPVSTATPNAPFSVAFATKYRGFEAAPRLAGLSHVTVITPTASPPRATTPHGADGIVAADAGSVTIALMYAESSATRATISVPRCAFDATAMRPALVPENPFVP